MAGAWHAPSGKDIANASLVNVLFSNCAQEEPALPLVVRMRYALGAVDRQSGGEFEFSAVAWTRWLVGRISELRVRFQTGLDDLGG
jgi:hypothetical protein